MTLKELIEHVKFTLTAGVLDLEIDDEAITRVCNEALRKLQRYTNEFRLIEVDYNNCIDLSDMSKFETEEDKNFLDVYSVSNVYRTKTIAGTASSTGTQPVDPVYLQFWTSFGLGMTHNLNQYLLNYASYSEMEQIRNTLSTDLFFKFDSKSKKLYVNTSSGNPTRIVIEYIPLYKEVEDVQDDYWLDYLKRLAVALCKQILGRVRTAVKQNNSLLTLDGDTILAEGNKELDELQQELEANTDYFWPID